MTRRSQSSNYARLDPNVEEKQEENGENGNDGNVGQNLDECIILEPIVNEEDLDSGEISHFNDAKASTGETIKNGDVLVNIFVKKKMYTVTERTNDYMELVILFGYTSLFVVAEPIIVPFALLSIVFEAMVDSSKLKYNFIRPFPQKVEDIGMIHNIFNFVAWLSAFSNMYLGAFITRTTYMDFILREYGRAGQFALFILAEHLILCFKVMLGQWVARIPNGIAIQKERQEFIQSKMFNHSQFSMSVAVEDGAKGRRQSVLKEDFKQLKLHRKHHNSDFKRVVDVSLSDESFCIVM